MLRGRIGVMCELKSPWRYRRHDVVARVERLPEDAVVLCFEPRAARGPRPATLQHVGLGVSIRGRALRLGGRLLGPARPAGGARARAPPGARDDGLHGQRRGADAELAALGVDGIFSDRPELLRRESARLSTRAVSPGKRASTFMPTG